MRPPRIQLRTQMIGIAFVALVLTVIMQTALLRRAAYTEHVLRTEATLQRAKHMAEVQRILAEAELRRAIAETALQRAPAEPGQGKGIVHQLLLIR